MRIEPLKMAISCGIGKDLKWPLACYKPLRKQRSAVEAVTAARSFERWTRDHNQGFFRAIVSRKQSAGLREAATTVSAKHSGAKRSHDERGEL